MGKNNTILLGQLVQLLYLNQKFQIKLIWKTTINL